MGPAVALFKAMKILDGCFNFVCAGVLVNRYGS